MKLQFYITLVLLILVDVAYAQDWKEELSKELVSIEDGKFKTVDYTLLTSSNGTSLQIQSYAEASADGFISRDNFVGIFAILTYQITASIATEAGLMEGEYKTKTMDELIGNADIGINCYMNKNGIQIEIITQEGTNRITQSWSDVMD